MKQRYSVFLRPWGVYYYEDNTTGKQETLKTRDKDEAFRLVAAKNENEEAPAFSLHLARVYWKAGDPTGATRTWQHVMDEIPKLKTGETRHRWLTAIKDKALDSIRNMVVLETQAEHFLKVLERLRLHQHLFAPHSQLRFGHELAAVAGAAQETLAGHQVQGKARHHLGRNIRPSLPAS
jgi:hypothetical protein